MSQPLPKSNLLEIEPINMLSLDELFFVFRSVTTFRRNEKLMGRKFAEQGTIYDESRFVQDLVRKGFLEKGSKDSHWSDFGYYRPTVKAMKAIEEIDAMLKFVNLRTPLNASNT